jgi:hypothetical protein
MKKLAELRDLELKWVQPNTFKQEYELHAGGEVAATLRFRSSFGSFATGKSADGAWTFKRVGFFRTSVTIRTADSETDLAVFKNNTWKNGGTLHLPDGRLFHADSNFWMTKYGFHTENSEDLVRYRKIGGPLHLSAVVEITHAARDLTELPWLVMLGWYLAVMMHHDASAAGAS